MAKAIWPESFVSDDSLVQCTVELRRALGDPDQQMIKTIPRRGYLFTAAVHPSRLPIVTEGKKSALFFRKQFTSRPESSYPTTQHSGQTE